MDINEEKLIDYYIKRVCLGHYVPCEICGKLHDDGGLMEYKGKTVYACFDCLESNSHPPSQLAT